MKSSFTFIKPLLVAFLTILFAGRASATYVPVTLTGFNQDVIADGIGMPTTSTTVAFDNSINCLVAPTYQQTATSPLPVNSLPASGTISSVQTTGLNFQLVNVTTPGNNSLRLTGTLFDTLTFSNQTYIGDIYMLAAAGDAGTSNFIGATVKVLFTDNSIYTFPAISIGDWFNQTSYAIQGVGRVNRSSGVLDAPTTLNPRLYEYKLVMPVNQYTKQIAGIIINKTATQGTINVMAVTVDNQTCLPPQNLTLNGSATMTSANFSWTALTGVLGYECAVTTTATPPASGTFVSTNAYSATSLNNGSAYYLHVRTKCSATSFSIWNTITFTTPACPTVPVSTISTSNITTVSADINWTAIGGSNGYEVNLSTSSTAPTSGTVQTNTSYNATLLTPGTQYYFYIRNHCTSPSNSVWTSISFTTLACPSAGAPSIVTNVPGSVTFTWPGTSTPGVINYQYQVTSSIAVPTTWLTTNNTVATVSGLTPGTTYYAHVRSNCGTSSGDQYVQFINTYPPCFAPAAITTADVNMHGANISWNSSVVTSVSGYQYAVDMNFAAPSTGTPTTDTFYSATGLTANTKYYVHVRTHCGALNNYSAWIIDSFTTPATCLIYTPSNVQIANITAHTAQISWQNYPGIYGYEYFIDNNPLPPVSGALAVNYSVITPQNLYSGTSYYLHLRIRCDTFNYSPWLDIPFNTPAICTAPSTASVNNITSNSASFNWSPVSSAQNYEYGVSTSSTPSPTGFYTANTNVTVNALQPSTNYYFHVRALCSSSDLSEWKTTAFNTYATSIVTVAGNKDFSLNVYPNPVKEVLNIEVTGNRKGKGTVMLLDLSGKLIDQIELSSDKGQLNLKNVSSGLYLLRYRDGENTETMRIQKQ
jgi:hypothetical protein